MSNNDIYGLGADYFQPRIGNEYSTSEVATNLYPPFPTDRVALSYGDAATYQSMDYWKLINCQGFSGETGAPEPIDAWQTLAVLTYDYVVANWGNTNPADNPYWPEYNVNVDFPNRRALGDIERTDLEAYYTLIGEALPAWGYDGSASTADYRNGNTLCWPSPGGPTYPLAEYNLNNEYVRNWLVLRIYNTMANMPTSCIFADNAHVSATQWANQYIVAGSPTYQAERMVDLLASIFTTSTCKKICINALGPGLDAASAFLVPTMERWMGHTDAFSDVMAENYFSSQPGTWADPMWWYEWARRLDKESKRVWYYWKDSPDGNDTERRALMLWLWLHLIKRQNSLWWLGYQNVYDPHNYEFFHHSFTLGRLRDTGLIESDTDYRREYQLGTVVMPKTALHTTGKLNGMYVIPR